MAVYQGVRLRTPALPPATPLPRSRAGRPATTTTPRVRPVGLLMAGILAATMVGLVYLTQSLGATATSEAIGKLETQRTKLHTKLAIQEIRAPDDVDVVTFAREHGRLRALPELFLKAP